MTSDTQTLTLVEKTERIAELLGFTKHETQEGTTWKSPRGLQLYVPAHIPFNAYQPELAMYAVFLLREAVALNPLVAADMRMRGGFLFFDELNGTTTILNAVLKTLEDEALLKG